jgi:hypothetical protein
VLKHFVLLTLAVVTGYAQTRQAPIAPITPITLYAQFQQEPPAQVLSAIREELKAILDPIGFEFQWRSLSRASANEVSVELAVLSFKGRCDAGGLLPHRGNPGALGWTHVSDGVILPFSDVDCDRIRSFVQRDLLTFPQDHREQVLGRAIARVVAHELYHIFANTHKHGSCGVGKAAYSVFELLAENFNFEHKETQALRTGRTAQVIDVAGGS